MDGSVQQLRKATPMSETFAEFVERERERLNTEMERVKFERSKLGDVLHALEREVAAIAAYENVKLGRVGGKLAGGSRTVRARKGSRREEIIAAISGSDGLSRGELLEKLGGKGDKRIEMAVSNACTALIKSNTLTREGGKYRLAA